MVDQMTEQEKYIDCTLHVPLEINFNKRPSKKIENMVLRGLHSTLTIFKRAGWICDYSMKGGEIDG